MSVIFREDGFDPRLEIPGYKCVFRRTSGDDYSKSYEFDVQNYTEYSEIDHQTVVIKLDVYGDWCAHVKISDYKSVQVPISHLRSVMNVVFA